MAGIVFKQSYRSRNLQGTPGLNVRHLHYVATRPGVVKNPGCGFGLWGRLPGDSTVTLQTDLERAEQIMMQRSESRTVYRAIISVGRETAEEKGMYHRENWEHLVNSQIAVIAKEMDIKPEHLCWCAAMHHAKDHPHVHILYWDDGSDPRPEGIGKNNFEKKAEHIRAAFSRELFREEILEQQQLQRGQQKEIRLLLRSLCREANPEKAVNVNRLYRDGTLEELAGKMDQLLRNIPAKGSLRYAYIPPAYRELVDDTVKRCLEIPEFRSAFRDYERSTRRIADLYGNGKAAEEKWQQAEMKLHRELGNEVLKSVAGIRKEIRLELLSQPSDLIQKAMTEIVPNLRSYELLQQTLPRHRIPIKSMDSQIPGFRSAMDAVLADIQSDARFRTAFEAEALKAAGFDFMSKPDAPASRSVPAIFGKAVTEDELSAYRMAYRQMRQELRCRIIEDVRERAGWNREAEVTYSMNMLCSMIRLLSQTAGQQQGRAERKRNYSKDRSKEAKKDYQAVHSSDGWEHDLWD